MIFHSKANDSNLYNSLLKLSRNTFFYNNIKLKDTFNTRIYLMFMHFSIFLIIFKTKKINFPQKEYDKLFDFIENDLRESGLGDVAVNKNMKNLNKFFYDILLKLNVSKNGFKINTDLIIKYFNELDASKTDKISLFSNYLVTFYNFCFDIDPQNMIQDALKFKVK